MFYLDKDENNWILLNDKFIKGNTFDFDLLDNFLFLNKKTYVLCNFNIKDLLEIFKKNGLAYKKDYIIKFKNEKEFYSVRLINYNNRDVIFKSYNNFFGIFKNKDIETNVLDMKKEYDLFCKLSSIDELIKYYSLKQVIFKEFKQHVNYSEDFEYKINQKEFDKFNMFNVGNYYQLNPKFKDKIIENVITYDNNAFFQWILMSYELPYGKPIYYCDIDQCNHKCSLIKANITAKIKDGHVPIIAKKREKQDQNPKIRKQLSNFYSTESNLDLLVNEEVYLTNNTLDNVFENYDVYDFQIIEYICFKSKKLNVKEYIDKWFTLREKFKDLDMKHIANEIKLSMNTIIGKFAQNYAIRKYDLDNENNLLIEETNINVNNKNYIPFYLFVCDYGRVNINSIANQFKDNFVNSVVDSIHLKDITIEEVQKNIEVKEHKIGSFKQVDNSKYAYFKSCNIYSKSNGLDKRIAFSKQSGIKLNEFNFKENTLNKVIERLRNEETI